MKNIIYVKYSNERSEKFKIKTCIVSGENGLSVEKSPLTAAAAAHVRGIYGIYLALKDNCADERVSINNCRLDGDTAVFDYIEGVTLDERLDELLDSKDYTALEGEISSFFDAVFNVKNKAPFIPGKDFTEVFGSSCPDGDYEASPVSNADIIFNNVILNNGYNIIDYEWTFGFAIPFKYIKYRAISTYILENARRRVLLDNDIYAHFDINSEEISAFEKMEAAFQSYVVKGGFSSRAFYASLDVDNHFVLDDVYIAERDRGLYAADVYFDRGEGFKGDSDIKLYNANRGGSTALTVSVPDGVRAVRIDPVSVSCLVYDIKIKDDKGEELPFAGSGCDMGSDIMLFADNDPNFVVKTKGVSSLSVSYVIKVLDSESAKAVCEDIKRIRAENNSLAVQLNERQGVVEQLNDTIRTYHTELENTRTAVSEANAKAQASLNEAQAVIAQKNTAIDEINRNFAATVTLKDNVIRDKDRMINEILNSTCWRMTAPIRAVIGGTKSFLHHNPVTGGLYEFLFYAKRDGFKSSMERSKMLKRAKKAQPIQQADGQSTEARLYVKDIAIPDSFNKTIAVHLHLYYVDLLDEFFDYFNNIPYTFDLFVSCKGGSDLKAIEKRFKKLKHVNKVDVRETINRGRDIAPLYVQFGSEIEKYDYFMHVHSKKSLFTGKEQYGWRQFNLDCLVGSEDTVKRIFALFESDKRVGLFYPETFGEMHLIAQDWLANAANGKALLDSMGIEFDNGLFNYPVGSFFWAKTDAVRPLFDRKFKYEDFPEEAGQTDGTIAHALERVISFVTRSRNYTEAVYDLNSGYISLGKSYKVYQEYFKLDYEAVQYHLSLFDLVSFDIFDTLITRAVYEPDDLFKIMGGIIKQKYGIDKDYLKMRKQAEALAFADKKESCNIHDIYARLPEVMDISVDIAEELKQLEIDLELELCLPRYDMLKVFNHVKACGKKIVLVSDMYLTADIIEKMLKKCGYEGYDDIWISCDRGARKDNDTIWKPFFDAYGALNTVHVGDSPRSDIQIPGDKQRRTFFVMNPRTAFKMSRYYSVFKPYINGSAADLLLLGMAVNGGLYNSPFAQGLDGEPVMNNAEGFGFACFGPLLTGFCGWLNAVTDKDNSLMFLSREGYLFEKIYNALYASNEGEKRRGVYLLTSRRAASVAAVRDKKDIKEIISQYYRGTLSNMLKARLGVELYADMTDETIAMPDDADKVMTLLDSHIDDILQKADKERQNYMAYLDGAGMDKNSVLVDVGYSGTIQYYMSKMLKQKITGAYLCTWINKKPEKIGCRCMAMYPVQRAEDEHTHHIFRNQLFLEAVLKAPYGQLTRFDENTEPVYKNDSVIGDELKALQGGAEHFAALYGKITAAFGAKPEVNKDMTALWFDTFLSSEWTGGDIARIMSVQDDYCSNGSQQFDPVTKSWKVI